MLNKFCKTFLKTEETFSKIDICPPNKASIDTLPRNLIYF